MSAHTASATGCHGSKLHSDKTKAFQNHFPLTWPWSFPGMIETPSLSPLVSVMSRFLLEGGMRQLFKDDHMKFTTSLSLGVTMHAYKPTEDLNLLQLMAQSSRAKISTCAEETKHDDGHDLKNHSG